MEQMSRGSATPATKNPSIRRFMLISAMSGALLLFAGAYLVVANVYNSSVREDSGKVSSVIAGMTFDTMYQVMRRGWTRQELEEFLDAMRRRFAETPYEIEIYRGPKVEELFGRIDQPAADATVRRLFAGADEQSSETGNILRHSFPLRARSECLQCHTNARIGDTLGVIDLHQNISPVLQRARASFIATLWLIIPVMLGGALLVAWIIHRRIDLSVNLLRNRVAQVNRVSDLAAFTMQEERVGFHELDQVLDETRILAQRMRGFAVDKELLEFEIRLLERFIITSDVVRDWREYIGQLLLEINHVIESYVLFSVFKVEDEQFDLEIFWRSQPSTQMREQMEESARSTLRHHPFFVDSSVIKIRHNVADSDTNLPELSLDDIELQSKNLFVESPKIGGIVGIGVQAGLGRDSIQLLVTESILTTLLNVVGSVKAIYKYTRELEHYATRDPLTNLYNQRVFWELLGNEIKRAERSAVRIGLMVIDLDNFKVINDSYGHTFGDRYLQSFADLLQSHFRQGDIVFRYGGDEFVVMLVDTPDSQMSSVAERMLEESLRLTIQAPDGKQIRVTTSIGIAIYPIHGEDPKDLFMVADNMMYRAKQEGKNRILMATDQDIAQIYRQMGEKNLAILAALDERRFIPYFQPIIDNSNGRIYAYEVLSRMLDPAGEAVPASEFIDTAERMGVVHKLDYLVMEHAFSMLQGHATLLFINISPKALILNEFIPTVQRMAATHGIEHQQIVFELTERDTVRNFSLLKGFVNELKMEGFMFAIDDFGSGFSSFQYLKHFPIDYVKIDGEFIINLMHDERDQTFVRHMAGMAGELGIRTIAEFVEDHETLNLVREAGIDFAQGYAIGRPAPDLKHQGHRNP